LASSSGIEFTSWPHTTRAPCSPCRNCESRQADTRISTSFCSSADSRLKKFVPAKATWTLSTGPSLPTGRLQSIAVVPFHWFFFAVSYSMSSS